MNMEYTRNMRLTRCHLLQSNGLAAVACALPLHGSAQSATGIAGEASVELGIASYTFRNFDRSQMIGFMKQLRLTNLNLN